jgi:hypothetical protein
MADMISSVRPNWVMAPFWITMSTSVAASRAGRWAMITTVLCCFFRVSSASRTPASPSASRLEVGSSSTIRAGRP